MRACCYRWLCRAAAAPVVSRPLKPFQKPLTIGSVRHRTQRAISVAQSDHFAVHHDNTALRSAVDIIQMDDDPRGESGAETRIVARLSLPGQKNLPSIIFAGLSSTLATLRPDTSDFFAWGYPEKRARIFSSQ